MRSRAKQHLRLLVLLFGGTHLILSTGLVLIVVDLVAPVTTKAAPTADFPCAGHGCGCDSAEDCSNGCCCFPDGTTPPGPAKGEIPLSVVELACCQGLADEDGLLASAPALPGPGRAVPPDPSSETIHPPALHSPVEPAADSPDKVPILRS